ncbi:nuclease-related domain-containing protein [Eubacterium sp. 1001713B170207_170306_E7]|uniref:nuclease-related domain-containing protein n=1 Tax=Eubacterium sp. 1001713B170207_170306_E7 TaxID=2787097 RepID=UPI001897AF3C|nr:nuclease-related domain-containing protein [Eubacterium sp. 1001713B170207_170306_E7]
MLWLFLLGLFFAVAVIFNQWIKNKKKRKAGEMGETEVYQILNKIIPGSSVVFRNLYLPTAKGSTEIDLLLLTRKGFFVFEIKNYRGNIFGDERYSEWVKILSNGRRVPFYNPIWQNEGHIRALLCLFPEINPKRVYSRIVFCGSSEIKKVKIKSRNVLVLKQSALKRKMKWKLRLGFNRFSRNELSFFEKRLQEFADTDRRVKHSHKKQVKSLKKRHLA